MSIFHTRAFRASVATAASLAVVVSLSGCFANPIEGLIDKVGEEAAKGGVEKIIEDASGGDIELDGQLPAGFPAEIPLIDREIALGAAIPGDNESEGGWMVTMKVNDPAKAIDEARQLLLDGGFEETMWRDAGMLMGVFTNGTYTVTIGAMGEKGEDALASYTIGHASEE